MGRHRTRDIYSIYKAVNNTGFGPQWKYDRNGNVYVFVTVGAGYVDISGITLYWEYGRLRNDLNAALRASGESVPETSYGVKPSFAMANLLIKKPRYGVKDTTNHFRLGIFVAELKARGWNPYVLLRVPKYASSELSNVAINSLPTRVRPRYVWYNATNVPKNAEINVSASVSPAISAFLIYIKFILPCIGLLSALVGLFIGLNHRISANTRSSGYDWGAGICSLVVFAGVISYFAFNFSIFGITITDMWFANPESPQNGLVFADMLWAYGLLFLIGLIMLLVKGRVFRNLDEDPDLEDIDITVTKIRKSIRIINGICLGFAAYLLIAKPFVSSTTFRLEYLIFACIPFLFGKLEAWLQRDNHDPCSRNEELTLRAKELAVKLGVELNEVKVITNDEAKKTVGGWANRARKTVYITQQSIEILSPSQMDVLLGHELAHFRDSQYIHNVASKFDLCCILVSVYVIAYIIIFTNITSLIVLWLAGPVVASTFLPVGFLGGLSRRLEIEADMQAVLLTGDVDMAISALQAVYENRANKANLDDDTEIHPKLSKRIKAMRIAGEKLKALS